MDTKKVDEEPEFNFSGYFGHLSKDQEQALQELQKKCKAFKGFDEKRYDEPRLLRFLRARSFAVDLAAIMIQEDIKWRKEQQIDNILESFPKEPCGKQLLEYWANVLHGTDKFGLPILVERLGVTDPKGVCTFAPLRALERLHIYNMERADKAFVEASKRKDGTIRDIGIISILDLTDLGWKQMYAPAVTAVKSMVKIDKEHYPEILRKLYIVNCPSIFSLFWKIFKPLLDPRTVSKTEIHPTGYLNSLLTQASIDQLPHLVEGKCTAHENCVPGGGPFPYKSDNVTFEIDHSLPNEVTIKARSVHKIPIVVKDPFSTIVWSWSVAAHNIGFTIKKERENQEEEDVIEYVEHNTGEAHQSQIIVEESGTYTFHWDNSYSKMRSKTITYSIQVLPPANEDDLQVAKSKKSKKKKKKKKKKSSTKDQSDVKDQDSKSEM